jgi:glycerol uptake facilitator protein
MNPMLVGEFFGTMVLIIFGGGVVANVVLNKSKGQNSGWIVIATGWFIAVMMGVFVDLACQGSAPGVKVYADLNPAISFVNFLQHDYSLLQFFENVLAEIAGAFVGAIVVWLAYLPHWSVTESGDLKRAVFCTAPAIRHYPSNFLCEVIATMILVFGVGAIMHTQSIANGLGPYLVGALVWGIGLSLGGPTGYAINPARDFGPRLAYALLPIKNKGGADWAYAWLPVIAPMLGAGLGYWLWTLVFLS